jgi:hypothetical protein
MTERVRRLQQGLQSLGLAAGQEVVVLCCKNHVEDQKVAVAATISLGATPLIPPDWSATALNRLYARGRTQAFHLACEEGVAAWNRAGGRGLMIGDGEGVLWWKALESRFASSVTNVGATSLLPQTHDLDQRGDRVTPSGEALQEDH